MFWSASEVVSARPEPPFLGVYVHVPFCRRKCAYCAFYSRSYDEALADAFVDALLEEAGRSASGDARTLYVGGGTPSVLSEHLLEKLLDGLLRVFPNVFEWTIEANPDSLSAAKARIMKDAGVTRVSVGVQSLSSSVLSIIGRVGGAPNVPLVMETLTAAGFSPEQVSFDAIYGIRGQTDEDIEKTVGSFIKAGAGHVSLYGFTLEPDSRLSLADNSPIASDETFRRHHLLIDRMLTKTGILRYELSNYAMPGRESLHNMNYWTLGEWLGLGPAASGTLHSGGQTARLHNLPDVADYIDAVGAGDPPPRTIERLSKDEELEEEVLLGLRLAKGLDEKALEGRFGRATADGIKHRADALIERGLLERRDERLIVPLDKILLTDEVTVELLAGRPE